MTDNELNRIREKISCPQFGDAHYGEWGILTLNQRHTIKRMLDYIDAQEKYINRQKAEIERLNKENDRLSQVVLYHDGEIADAIENFKDGLLEKAIATSNYFEIKSLVQTVKKEMVGDAG